MDLITPGIGLIFWQAVVFLLLFVILKRFAWGPIIDSLRIREDSIEDALRAADEAKKEMADLKADNEKLLEKARKERDEILKQATAIGNKIKEEAKVDALKAGEILIKNARTEINSEKQAALAEVKDQVAQFSLEIASKLLRQNLADQKSQTDLVKKFLKDINFN